MVVPWHDPVVDSVGFDVRSQYVELFWLNVLGPTATWILRRLVLGFDRYPLGYELDLAETASALGLSYTAGTANSFMRALNRCVLFGVSQPTDGGLAVRRECRRSATATSCACPRICARPTSNGASRRRGSRSPTSNAARVLAEAMVETGDEPERSSANSWPSA